MLQHYLRKLEVKSFYPYINKEIRKHGMLALSRLKIGIYTIFMNTHIHLCFTVTVIFISSILRILMTDSVMW